jgi:hypothetical protein
LQLLVLSSICRKLQLKPADETDKRKSCWAPDHRDRLGSRATRRSLPGSERPRECWAGPRWPASWRVRAAAIQAQARGKQAGEREREASERERQGRDARPDRPRVGRPTTQPSEPATRRGRSEAAARPIALAGPRRPSGATRGASWLLGRSDPARFCLHAISASDPKGCQKRISFLPPKSDLIAPCLSWTA